MITVGREMTNHNKRCVRKAGLTLIEVVVAMTVLVMVLAGSYTLVSQSVRLNDSARKRYLATTLARSRLERAETFQFEDLHLLVEDKLIINQMGAPNVDGDFRRSTIIDTNYSQFVTAVDVVVEIRDGYTGQFDGQYESVSSLFTKYIEPPGP